MDNWEKIEEIFNTALNIAPSARIDFVTQKCGGDKQLKHQVLTLLNADNNSDNYLSSLSETLYPLINDIEIDKVKHYQLLNKIGEGGMGIVYKAFDKKLHRTVAIKFLLSYRAKNPSDKQRFIHEAKAAAGLNHPNVCEVYEVDETDDGRLYIVTAFCEGKNLSELIEEKQLTIGDLFTVIIQLCDALKTAHDSGIIHRDLKPENIIINDKLNIQLVDFGIAKIVGTEMSQTGQVVGTFAYMSPEQFSSGIIDQRTDIWALGILLFESLTGHRPFRGDNAAEIMYQIFNNETPNILLGDSSLTNDSKSSSAFSNRMNHIIRRCLSIEKQKRYHSTEIVKNELINLLNNAKATGEDKYFCSDTFQNDRSEKRNSKFNHTINEYRKILTLGISLKPRASTRTNVKSYKDETLKITSTIKEFSGAINNNDNNIPQLIIAHYGFPLVSEKHNANMLNCIKKLLPIPIIDTIIVHNLPVTISDDNKTGLRKILGDIFGTIHSLINTAKNRNYKSETSVLITESASIRLRKNLSSVPSEKPRLNSPQNENIYQLSKADAITLLSPNRDQYTTQLMGRYHELGLLESSWNDAYEGDSRAVLITGEAGMGKTRLIHELVKTVTLDNNLTSLKPLVIDCTFDPLQQDTAFYPIIKAISKNIVAFEKVKARSNITKPLDASTPQNNNLVSALSATQWLSNIFELDENKNDAEILLWLLGKANCIDSCADSNPKDSTPKDLNKAISSPLHESAESLKKKSVLLLNKILASLTLKQPTLLIFEDLHWADFSSLEWIDNLLSKPLPHYLLTVMTGRPELFHRWRSYSDLTQLSLNKLGKSESRDFIHSLHTESLLSEDIENRIIEKTAGNPLFIEEYVNMVARKSGELKTDAVPDSLEDILLSKLDLLGHSKAIAQTAAVIGRIFDEHLLREVLENENIELSNNLAHHLSLLNEADIIFQKSNHSFTFKHALIRDALYHTISFKQREKIHNSIANILSNAENEKTTGERIAQHYSLGANHQQSIQWWLNSAANAWSRHALLEVIRLCNHGIEDIETYTKSIASNQPIPNIKNTEIELQLILGRAAAATEGYASETAAKAHQRALHLATSAKEKLTTYPSLIGMWAFYCVSAQHLDAEKVAQTLVDIADQYNSDDLAVEAYMLRGTTHLFRGNFSQSAADLSFAEKKLTDEMQKIHIDTYGQDPGVIIYSFFAILKEISGQSEEALTMSQQAIDSARRSQHPFSLSFALSFAVHIQIRLKKNQQAQQLIDENKQLCADHGIHVFRLLGAIQEGLLCIANGQALQGISLIEKNIPLYQSMGANLFMGTWHGVLSLTYLKIGDKNLAIEHYKKGIEAVNISGERLSQGVLLIAAQHLNEQPNFIEPLQLNGGNEHEKH